MTEEERYVLRLYITGATPRSTRAVKVLREICEQELQGRYDLEVIDLYQNPEKAREAQIVAVPTLIKQLPRPLRRVVGDLANDERLRLALDLQN